MVYIKRGFNKIQSNHGLKDFYKYYKENAKNPLDYNTFSAVWKDVAKSIIKLVVYRNLDFMIPARMGTLCIRKMKAKPIIKPDGTISKNKMSIDYKSSWEKWKREYPELTIEEIAKLPNKKHVYYLNDHSDGYKIKWMWDKYTCTVRNQNIYSLQIARPNKQEASKAFVKFKTDYYEHINRRVKNE